MFKNKILSGLIKTVIVIAVAAAILGAVFAFQTFNNKLTVSVDLQQVQQITDDTFSGIINPVATGSKYVYENSKITVKKITYGTEKDIIALCDYETLDVESTVKDNIDKYITKAYALSTENAKKGIKTNATLIKQSISSDFMNDLEKAAKLSGELEIHLYEAEENTLSPYLSDETVNAVFGGLVNAEKIVSEIKTVKYNGETISIANQNTLRTGVKDCFSLRNYDSRKPDTSIPLVKAWNNFKYDFERNFIYKNQWKYLSNGLITTLEITALAVLLGILIGFVVAVIRVTNQKTGKLKLLSTICKIYLSVMRGTPVMVQLLIVYFVVLLPLGVEKFPAAVLCFGLNSGAYVSEIVRGGIVSIDNGQTEAGRSLGFNYMQTMYYIVIPQAFKAVLPSLANEFITLLKESSVAFYIGVADLTLGGIKIRSNTYSNYMPLIAVALIYLVVVLGLTKCVGILERRLRKSDNR